MCVFVCSFTSLGSMVCVPSPCYSWLGFLVCVLVPRHSWLGFVVLVPRPSWLGFVVHVFVSSSTCLGSAMRVLVPRQSWMGFEVLVFVCSFTRLGSMVHVLSTRHSWLGFVARVPVPRQSWLGFLVRVFVGSFTSLGSVVCVLSPSPSWLGFVVCVLVPRRSWLGFGVCGACAPSNLAGVRGAFVCAPLFLPRVCGPCVSSAMLAFSGLAAPSGRCCPAPPPWLWPAACFSDVPCGPASVCRASSGPVALGAAVGCPVAVVPSLPGSPRCTLHVTPSVFVFVAVRGTWRPTKKRPLVPACRPVWTWAASASYPFRAPGVVSGGSLWCRSWAECAAVVLCVWTRSLTRPVSRTVRLAAGLSASAPGLFCVDAGTSLCGLEGNTPRSLGYVCVRVRPGRVGRDGPDTPPYRPSWQVRLLQIFYYSTIERALHTPESKGEVTLKMAPALQLCLDSAHRGIVCAFVKSYLMDHC